MKAPQGEQQRQQQSMKSAGLRGRAPVSKRRLFAVFVAAGALSVCALVRSRSREPPAEPEVLADGTKTVLYWNSFFDQADFYLGQGEMARGCPGHDNCLATSDRFARALDSFDAVLFHGISGQLREEDLPARRGPAQRYVFAALESPANREVGRVYDGYFNATMSYMGGSDLLWSYADLLERRGGRVLGLPVPEGFAWRPREAPGGRPAAELRKLLRKKHRLAAWFRSNCETRGGREDYVRELERHASVDKFGACSEEPGCPRGRDCLRTEVQPRYFFYLSFENSLCEDYVTEKFFNALQYYVIPVVYGGANYSRFAPPKSYVNALDFDTPKELANFMIKLSRNVTEYNKYFEWKKHYRFVSSTHRVACNLCDMINGNQRKSYKISEWYSTEKCPLQLRLDEQIRKGGVEYATRRTIAGQ